jgi:hypothetical protein
MAFKMGRAFESNTKEGVLTLSGNDPSPTSTQKRTGDYALSVAAGSQILIDIGEALPDAILQVCNWQENYMDGLTFGLRNNATNVAWVVFDNLRRPTLHYQGGAATVGPLLGYDYAFATWHTAELELTTIGAVADVRLRLDGDVVIEVEGVDTRASGGAITTVDRVIIINPFTATCYVDDVAVFDHSGTENNSWPDGVGGERTNVTLDGTYEQFDASTGTDHYALIDETTPSAADYIQTGTASEKDSFVMEDVTGMFAGAVDILAFQVIAFAEEPNGPSGRTLDTFIIVDGNDHMDGVDHTLSPAMAFCPGKLWEENPETGNAWSIAELDDIEIGVESGA